jgi:hypothetical protein
MRLQVLQTGFAALLWFCRVTFDTRTVTWRVREGVVLTPMRKLPPGVYTLSFAPAKFQPDYCPDIALNVDQTLRVDVFFIPEGVYLLTKYVPCNSPQR